MLLELESPKTWSARQFEKFLYYIFWEGVHVYVACFKEGMPLKKTIKSLICMLKFVAISVKFEV